jgi:hypothetical protein
MAVCERGHKLALWRPRCRCGAPRRAHGRHRGAALYKPEARQQQRRKRIAVLAVAGVVVGVPAVVTGAALGVRAHDEHRAEERCAYLTGMLTDGTSPATLATHEGPGSGSWAEYGFLHDTDMVLSCPDAVDDYGAVLARYHRQRAAEAAARRARVEATEWVRLTIGSSEDYAPVDITVSLRSGAGEWRTLMTTEEVNETNAPWYSRRLRVLPGETLRFQARPGWRGLSTNCVIESGEGGGERLVYGDIVATMSQESSCLLAVPEVE